MFEGGCSGNTSRCSLLMLVRDKILLSCCQIVRRVGRAAVASFLAEAAPSEWTPAPPSLSPFGGGLSPWWPASALRPSGLPSAALPRAGPPHEAEQSSHSGCTTAPSQLAASAVELSAAVHPGVPVLQY